MIGLPRRQRKPTPAEWGIGMTVCIAGIAELGRTIISVSDQLLSWGITSGGQMLKALAIHEHWFLMMSGDDITQAETIVRDVSHDLSSIQRPSEKQVRAALERAWRRERVHRAETIVLAPFNLTLQEFIKDGRSLFGDSGFADIRVRIETESAFSLGIIVAGYDNRSRPRLFKIEETGIAGEWTRIGFVAIGSGATMATTSLVLSNYQTNLEESEALYELCAAKFVAESAPGVGRETLVSAHRVADGSVAFLVDPQLEPIRQVWHEQGRARRPKRLDTSMPKLEFQAVSESEKLALPRPEDE